MRNKLRFTPFLCVLIAALLVFVWPGLPGGTARAEGFTVTKFTDTADGVCDGDCSLREAIIAANATPGVDTITLEAGTYVLTLVGDEDLAAAGDLDVLAPLNLVGQGAEETIIDASGLGDRAFDVRSSDQVHIESLTVSQGTTSGEGGAIYADGTELTLENVVLSGNSVGGASGGGLSAWHSDVTLINTQVISNTAAQGAGVYTNDCVLNLTNSLVGYNNAFSGGGLWIQDSALAMDGSEIVGNSTYSAGAGLCSGGTTGAFTITNSLVADNIAGGEGGGFFLAHGESVVMENCTISGNEAGTYGGGINTRMPITITHSTIVDNVSSVGESEGGGGGLFAYYYGGGAAVFLQNTIIANNEDRLNSTYDDCMRMTEAPVTSLGYNLVENVGNCTFANTGDITGQDPLLGVLADNGGSTRTHALLVGSPAIDTGDPAVSSVPAYDQRGVGYARVTGGRVDIGAYEYGSVPPTPTPTVMPTATVGVTPTVPSLFRVYVPLVLKG